MFPDIRLASVNDTVYINDTVSESNKPIPFEAPLTHFSSADNAAEMTKPKTGVKPTQVRLTPTQRQRIEALVGNYGMSKFIREAVERELERREAEAGDKQ